METSGLRKEGKKDSKMLAALVAILVIASVSALFVSRIAGEEETSDEETLPPYLGKSLSAQIQDLVQQHKEALLEIRLERKIMGGTAFRAG
ncbi:MAG: hypothetical protein QW797_07970 [Thermoproteota archaeon]